MCGIIGIFKEGAGEELVRGISTLRNRGRDAYGITDGTKVLIEKSIKKLPIINTPAIGHCLHKIIDYVPQPLRYKNNFFIANCEIYNWRELNEKHGLKAKNDAEVIFKLLLKKLASTSLKEAVIKTINELDGVFAFAVWTQNKVILARDIIGVKPIWYTLHPYFSFASEKKALLPNAIELNPRNLLVYDLKTKKVNFIHREFFKIYPEHKGSLKELTKKTAGYIINAIAKRIPDQKFGILFSGGIDSTIIAEVCKQLNVDFTCYTAAITEKGLTPARDLVWAKKVAQEQGFRLKIKEANLNEAERALKKVVPLIEDSNVVKAGVALTFYLACREAKKDGLKVIFSGLGSEEIFAGYQRHTHAFNVNRECIYGLLNMYERDNYRDDVITMNNNLELRVPFLDKALVDFAVKIPHKYKLSKNQNKIILREAGKLLGIPDFICQRKKLAAQYGSKTDKAITKIAHKNGYRFKSDYLKTLYPSPNLKLGVLFSSGKDSCYAMYRMFRQNYEIRCLLTIKSKNPDSYMFHTPNIDLTEVQSKCLGIPLLSRESSGKKELELEDLKKLLSEAKEKYKINGVVSGALFSNYQRERIEKICDELSLKVFSPLWHMDQEVEMKELVSNKFEFIFSSISAYGLDESWLGKIIDNKDIEKLSELNETIGFNVAGEGGEYESFVIDMPMFKQKIRIKDAEIKKESKERMFYIIKKYDLVSKNKKSR